MTVRTTIAGILLFTACVTGYPGQGDQPSAPSDAKDKAPTKQQPAPAAKSGAMVFIDPVTRQIRQPTEAEIGALSAATTATAAANAQSAPAPTLIQGPGAAVGLKLGADSMSYMVVTKTPDGKLVIDCVTGDAAAAARTAAGATQKTDQPTNDKQPPQR